MGKNSEKKKLGPVFNFKLGPALTLKPPNFGPVFNFTEYIYIYAVELKLVQDLGFLALKTGPV